MSFWLEKLLTLTKKPTLFNFSLLFACVVSWEVNLVLVEKLKTLTLCIEPPNDSQVSIEVTFLVYFRGTINIAIIFSFPFLQASVLVVC